MRDGLLCCIVHLPNTLLNRTDYQHNTGSESVQTAPKGCVCVCVSRTKEFTQWEANWVVRLVWIYVFLNLNLVFMCLKLTNPPVTTLRR